MWFCLLLNLSARLHPSASCLKQYDEAPGSAQWTTPKTSRPGTPPLALFHKTCRSWFSAKVVWQENGEPVDARKIRVRIPNDYWIPARPRKYTAPAPFVVGRIGSGGSVLLRRKGCCRDRRRDRWTFLVLQELFHGNHRFDDFINGLEIAPGVLSGRLANLHRAGFIEEERRTGRLQFDRDVAGLSTVTAQ